MHFFIRLTISCAFAGVIAACGGKVETPQNIEATAQLPPLSSPSPTPTPETPDLQAELTDSKYAETSSPIGKFDFRNFKYELPRGWQNPDGTTDIELQNGKAEPVAKDLAPSNVEAAEIADKSRQRIGMSLVSVKYFDATGDGNDEAVVVLKIETGGAAIPQIVYVFGWKDEKPELLWHFRTGDRAEGGLKCLAPKDGMLAVELYGQDRFILGQIETGRIEDDRPQICCPTHYTRSVYKWNGKNFLIQGKRLTFPIDDPAALPVENMGEKVSQKKK
ncbi:MAG: hypothetical protein IPM50_10670 [Acidobacteriota bacterium]|nr:MAG: hypothetical protein IPM50_10670 [Acidobacteriota bacterium]